MRLCVLCIVNVFVYVFMRMHSCVSAHAYAFMCTCDLESRTVLMRVCLRVCVILSPGLCTAGTEMSKAWVAACVILVS